jgi:hypothetical protein
MPVVYDELRRRATAHVRRERGGHALQPTELVHEVYLRLVQQDHATSPLSIGAAPPSVSNFPRASRVSNRRQSHAPETETLHAQDVLPRTTDGFQTGQRSLGHGNWSRGARRYNARTMMMILFDNPPGTPPGSPGFQAGWQVTTHSIRRTSRNTFNATGGAEFFDLNRQVYRQACAVRTGERFQ